MIRSLNILIVDDNIDFADSLVDLLSHERYVTKVAYSLDAAISAIDKFDAKIALIDIRLGSSSGLSLVEYFHKKNPDLLCIMMTAYAEVDTAIQAIQNGAFDYLRKPISAEDLFFRIKRGFDRVHLVEDKKHSDQMLRKNEEKFRFLIESMSDGLVVHDRDGAITYVNDRFCEILNIEREKIIADQILNYLDSVNRDIFISEAKCRDSKQIKSYDLTWDMGSGGKVPTIVSPRLVTDRSGNFNGCFYVVTDISERKQFENLVRMQRDLGLMLSKTNDLKLALKIMLDAAIRIGDMDNGSIMMVNDDDSIFLAHYEGVAPGFAKARSNYDSNHPFAKIIHAGKPIYRNHDEIGYSIEETQRREGLTCYAMIPIAHENRSVASLNVGSHYKKEIPLFVRSALEAVASQVGGVISRIEFEQDAIKEKSTLDNILNLNPYGIAVFNTDGSIIRSNRAFIDLFGVNLPQYIPSFSNAFLNHPEITEKFNIVKLGKISKIHNITFNPNHFDSSFNDKIVCVSITFFPIYAPHGGVEKIVAMFEDVTQNMQTIESLKESEEKFKAIVYGSQDLIFIKDKNFTYIFLNPKALDFVGLSEQQVIGKSDLDIWGEKNDKNFRLIDKKVLKGETVSYETALLSAKGEKRTFFFVKVPIKDANGIINSICAIAHDITERRRFETSLVNYQKQLQTLAWQLSIAEESERRHIATWIHDNFSQSLALVKMKTSARCEICEIKNTCDNSQEINEIISNLIADARTVTFELTPPILYELGLPDAVEWLAEEYQKRHNINVNLSINVIPLSIDEPLRGFLFQCIRELLINIQKHADASNVDITLKSDNNSMNLNITDNGKGFDAKKILEIEYEQRGFGLFSIRERLKHLNGILVVDSKSGQGTLVRIVIPLNLEQ